jgi:hypothetical protein
MDDPNMARIEVIQKTIEEGLRELRQLKEDTQKILEEIRQLIIDRPLTVTTSTAEKGPPNKYEQDLTSLDTIKETTHRPKGEPRKRKKLTSPSNTKKKQTQQRASSQPK